MNDIVTGLDPLKVYKVVFYARVSTEEEKQINALEKQVEELTNFINTQVSWCLVDQYIDEGKTGTTSKGRKEYNRLYEDIMTDKFDIVVIKDISRMNRNTGNYYQFINRILTQGKLLYMYLDRKFYNSDDAFLNGIKAMMAEEYSRDLSKKITSASQRSIKQGVAYGNSRIYGYTKIPRSFIINEEEAAVVRQIFDWYIEGYGFRIIQKKLTEMGVYSSTGNQFSLSTLKRMIKNEKYKGLLVSGKTHYDFDTKRLVEVPKEERHYIPDGIPAIVTEEVWEQANSIIRRKAKLYDDNRIRGVSTNYFAPEQSALSGKIFCGKCGKVYWHSPYTTQVNKLRRDVWICSTYKSWGVKYCKNHNIEFYAILNKVKEILYQENKEDCDIAEVISLVSQSINDTYTDKTLPLQKQLDKYNKRLNNLADLVLDGTFSKDEFIAKKTELVQKINSVQSEIERTQLNQERVEDKESRLRNIRKFLEAEIETTDDVSDDYIRKYIDKITIYDEKVIIETQSGNSYTVDPDEVRMKFSPRNKKYLEQIRQNRAQTNT